MKFSPEVAARFWSKVNMPNKDRTGPVGNEGCWLWTGYTRTGRMGNGLTYGRFKAKIDGRWQHVTAHRMAYELSFGSIPDGKCVLHRCDTPLCCNPKHLFVGTLDDNNKDRAEKCRSARGTAHPKSRLSESDVLEIVRLKGEGWTFAALAEKYGVANGGIQGILEGKSWSHLTGIERKPTIPRFGENHHNAKLTIDQVREIRKQYEEIQNLAKLSKTFGVSRATIRDIVQFITWRDA